MSPILEDGPRLLKGGPIAASIREKVAADVAAFKEQFGYTPGLTVLVVGADAPSLVYLNKILDGCRLVGIKDRLVELPADATEADVSAAVERICDDRQVAGLIVQQPLPKSIGLRAVIDVLDPLRDIDGIHPTNAGLLSLGYDGFLPATAHASIEILKQSGIQISGKRAVVVGRSNVIGKPAALLLVRENATVTICHSKTDDLPGVIREADIVVVAIGKANFVTGDMLKPGAVVVDVGINVVDGKLVGDVEFDSAVRRASAITPRPILEIAEEMGFNEDEIELYGRYKAKITIEGIERKEREHGRGKYVLVTAISPTPLGEGKSTTTVGLAQGLQRIGKKATVALRQPSLGPVFGIKGGAAGGGYSQVIPMEDFNLHLTGDTHAIGAAHNLAAAFIDNHIHHGNELGIDANNILWPRVLDISDRALRDVVVGLGGKDNGYPRQTQFVITVASEVMAILALATDLKDLRARLGRIVLATKRDGTPITAEDLKVAGSMAVLLKDALKPNLMQTLEGGPAFVHCGPFANIAHGNNSVMADRAALAGSDILVTEAGFGADMGAEKFFDIKCRASGLKCDAAVIVATIRALKMNGGVGKVVAGKPLDPALLENNPEGVRKGGANLAKQIENVKTFGVPVVVAINIFPTDTPDEIQAIKDVALAAGAEAAVEARHFTDGGAGAEELAKAVWAAAEKGADMQFLYPDDMPLTGKIEAIATRIYGADGVDYSPAAKKQLAAYEAMGYGNLPICMAKTQYSLSHDAKLLGAPKGFRIPVREVRLYAGAGFVTPILGDMRTMPGLNSRPGGERIDIDADGNVVGLF